MSTTTIRLPNDLKARIATAAEHAGMTSHHFILQAIAEKATQEELRRDFNDLAEQRYANIVATGETISWNEMRRYLEDRLAGQTEATRPVAKKWVP